MRVLICCEFSGIVRDAFAAKGHDAWSCDLLPTEKPGNHYQCDVREVLNDKWDLIIAHPPCTYLANSGVRWLYEKGTLTRIKDRWDKMKEAAEFFKIFLNHPCDKICIENPIQHSWANLPKPDQRIQPWQFGHGETKAICLWLKGLRPLQYTDIVREREAKVHRMPPSPERWKNRSRFYTGVAAAMANQWADG